GAAANNCLNFLLAPEGFVFPAAPTRPSASSWSSRLTPPACTVKKPKLWSLSSPNSASVCSNAHSPPKESCQGGREPGGRGRLPRRANYEGPSRATKRSLPPDVRGRHGRQFNQIVANGVAAANTPQPVFLLTLLSVKFGSS